MNITLSADHVYTVDGIEKPGVTSILDHCGLIPDFSKNDFAAERGTAVHHGAALLFKGYKLKDLDIDERIVLCLASLERFIETTGFKAIAVEQSAYGSCGLNLEYCGTYDALGLFPTLTAKTNGKHEFNTEHTYLLDLKSGAPAKWHKLQTAAYMHLVPCGARGGLYLQADGSLAKLVEHTDPNDWKAFYSALKIYHGEKALEKERQNLKAWMEEK